jgi:hypothetical protein
LADVLKIYFQSGWTGPDGSQPVYSANNSVSFDDTEIISFTQKNNSNCVIADSATRHPSVFDKNTMNNLGTYGKSYTLELRMQYSTTREKVEKIVSFNNFLSLYYDYADDASGTEVEPGADEFTPKYFKKSQTSILVDQNYKEVKKYFGEEAALVSCVITFYNSNTYFITTTNDPLDGKLYRFDGKKIYYSMIVDPDGENISIDGSNDILSISLLTSGFDIEPQRSGSIEFNDIYVSFNNYKHYFENGLNSVAWERSGRKPFRVAYWRPKYNKVVSGNNWATIDCVYYSSTYGAYYGEIIPKVGDVVSFYDNTDGTTETFSIIEVGEELISGTYYYKITLNGTLTKTYNDIEDDLIYINSWIGKEVLIRMIEVQDQPYVHGVTAATSNMTITDIFRGVIREPFSVEGANTLIKIDNILNNTFNKLLTIKSTDTSPLYITSNNDLVNSITWTTQAGSGTLADTITVYDGAVPGKWIITFTSETDFSIIGPNYSGTGSTTSDFYDGTGATDSQIKIATTDWGGTPSADDSVEFFLSVNYNAKYIPTIIHDLVVTHGGETSENIVTTDEGHKAYISFNSQYTIGQAVSTLLQGTTFFISTDYQNRVILCRLGQWDRNTTASDFYNIVYHDGNVFSNYYKIGFTNIYNKFIIKYGYNYFTDQYEKSKIYPDSFSARNQSFEITGKSRTIEIEYPSMQDGTLDTGYSLYCLYGFGLRTVSLESSIIANSDINTGDILRTFLNGARVELQIISKTIDFNSMTIRYECVNNNRTFSTMSLTL